MTDNNTKNYLELRQRAEQIFAESKKNQDGFSLDSFDAVFHELSVHQIELEMQNTELNRAQMEIKKSRDEYSDLYNFAPVGYVTLDGGGLITAVNLKLSQMLAVNTNDLMGKSLGRFLDRKHSDLFHIHIRRALKTGDFPDLELKFQSGNDSSFWGRLHGEVITGSQDTILVRMAIVDISESKKLQDELLQTHKMQALGTLAGGIAHDFNNILSAIIGYSELVEDNIPSGNPAKDDIAMVMQSARRAADLVRQILTFSRKSEHDLLSLSPHLLVKEALKMLSSSLPSTVIIHEDIDVMCGNILADPTNILQIIMNLCTNALQAMEEEKGVITIKLYRKEITAEDVVLESGVSAGPFLVLTVSDTGSGMDEATKERIFEPFFSTKETGKGTGMGLAVVDGIIHDYKGFIRVDSKPGGGSTFAVYIPALQEDISIPEAPSPAESEKTTLPTGNERILVVDDEPQLVSLYKKQLELCGYTVTGTTNSKDALEKIRAQPNQFDLLVTDQTMPELSGVELARAVQELIPTLPIILCTGYSDIVSKEKALNQGIKRYVTKPMTGDRLLVAIREVLAEK